MVNQFSEIIKNGKYNTFLLQKKLISVLREYFNLRMKFKMGQLKQLHLFKRIRYNIALLRFYLSQNKNINKE